MLMDMFIHYLFIHTICFIPTSFMHAVFYSMKSCFCAINHFGYVFPFPEGAGRMWGETGNRRKSRRKRMHPIARLTNQSRRTRCQPRPYTGMPSVVCVTLFSLYTIKIYKLYLFPYHFILFCELHCYTFVCMCA